MPGWGRAAAPALLAALAAAGCGGGERTPSAGTSTAAAAASAARAKAVPALCRPGLRAGVAGRVAAPAATELSGLVLSRSQRGVLWAHNDSGDRPRLLALSTRGRLLAEVAVTGAQNFDWEDIAVGAAQGGVLLIGDIGDNVAQRASVVVYRVPEPRTGSAPATAPAQRIELRYPDGARDAEALLLDPSSGALVIVTKSFGGRAGVYVADRPAPGPVRTLRRAGGLSLGAGEAVTAGDVSADGRTIVLRSYDRAFAWTRRSGESVAAALRRRPCTARAGLLGEGQGETLALARDGRAFYTVPEGARPLLRRYVAPG